MFRFPPVYHYRGTARVPAFPLFSRATLTVQRLLYGKSIPAFPPAFRLLFNGPPCLNCQRARASKYCGYALRDALFLYALPGTPLPRVSVEYESGYPKRSRFRGARLSSIPPGKALDFHPLYGSASKGTRPAFTIKSRALAIREC